METVKICIFAKTQLDIERDVKNKRNISVQTHFYTKSKDEMGYHVAKKHAEQSSKQTTVCPFCEQEFPTYYSLQQYRRKELGAKQKKPSDTVADLNKIVEEEGEDGGKLKEELSACQHFLSFALKSHLLCSKADLINNTRKSGKIWYCGAMCPRTSKHKVAIQVDQKCDNFCCFAEKHSNGLSYPNVHYDIRR